jgi:hypothetical protein
VVTTRCTVQQQGPARCCNTGECATAENPRPPAFRMLGVCGHAMQLYCAAMSEQVLERNTALYRLCRLEE